ncbi:hypothetical protein [Sphingomonas sp.]|uniref:hypothetical protein n=1 Tax=Sphingomonas sp. TaxID=28214 RepID=UPI003AFFBBDF
MSLLDTILNQVAGQDLSGLAGRVGLSPEQLQMALSALHQAHPQPGDTATVAAGQTGLPVDALRNVLSHLGGEDALGQLGSVLGGGGSLGGLGGMLGGLTGRS